MLTDLHTAVVAHLSADVLGLQTCAAYPDLQGSVPIPAVLVETGDNIEPAKDAGTEQLSLTTRWKAYCIYDPSQANADLEVRNLAVTVALSVYLASRFGQPVGPAKIVFIGEDGFKPELDGYLVWAVEWEHDIRVGASIWDGAGVVPSEVNFTNEPNGAYEPLL